MKIPAKALVIAAAITIAAPYQPTAWAAGDDDDARPQQSNQKAKKKRKKKVRTCRRGYVYSSRRAKCVRKRADVVPDKDLKQQGWALARAGEYRAAMEVFVLVSDNADPEKWNGLGYTHRKTGLIDKGLVYYKKALALNPDYVLAREYLGEGFVAAGRIDLARLQLVEIGKRCGKTCNHYVQLAQVIEAGVEPAWRN